MSSISDESTDPLVERFKQLEETVQLLQRENCALRSKVQSYGTLSTFYHEARQQLSALGEQVARKDELIAGLRARFEGEAAAVIGELQPQPRGSLLAPAPSLVQSLMEQLSSARQQLRETEKSSRDDVAALSEEVQRLNEKLKERDKYALELSRQPQHEKELEIVRLQRSLAEKEKVQATSEVLCRSLTDETHQLRRKLAATAKMCQQLVKCIEESQRKEEDAEGQRFTGLHNKFPDIDTPPFEAIICKLQEENRTLKQKVTYVEDLNAKWQKYDASREEYVKRLHLQLRELKLAPEHGKGLTPVPANAELMQKEIFRLNRHLEEKLNECTHLKCNIEQMAKDRIGDGERMQMLEQQVLVYKDDFTSERADRERAQGKIQELQEEITRLQLQITRRQEVREAGSRLRCQIGNTDNTAVEPDVAGPLLGSSPDQLRTRRQITELEQFEVLSASGISDLERHEQGDLQCPRCLRLFNDELGEEFLKHISEC
ncbi:TNFAIP3-interacting protein 2 [Microcaecilia unicolor]|uniref:TNFAIP3-interacting protein 2 n=1 Tax=Microcaecilia unicolor TaxID=1415580 RepID=A0A6P7X0T8_9AMPH|nr:TNFAIP3-interacting protein 2 [Microcaecilia unicolor]